MAGELVYKDIDEFVEKSSLDGTEFIAVSATEKINLLEQIQLNIPSTDITTTYPLQPGEYYNLTTAVAQVQESVKKLGMEISFVRKVDDAFYHEVYKFVGQALSEFDDTSKWKLQQSYEYGNFLDYYRELFFGSSDTIEVSPIGNEQLDMDVPNEYPVEHRFDFKNFDKYLYIPHGFIIKTQLVLRSLNGLAYSSRVNLFLNTTNIQDLGDLQDDSAVKFPSGSIQQKAYISLYKSEIFIKPGDTMSFMLVFGKAESGTDTISLIQTTTIPAMVSFFDKTYFRDLIKRQSPAQMTATGFILNNCLLEPNQLYFDLSGYYNLYGNGGGFLKWNQSTLQLYLSNWNSFIDGILVPNELPHKLFLQNTGAGNMTISFSISTLYSEEGILKSTFGGSYVLGAGKSIIIKYQWYHDNGDMICLLDKSADFVTV